MFSHISKRSLALVLADILTIAVVVLVEFFLRTGTWSWLRPWHPFHLLTLMLLPMMYYVFDLYYPYKIFKAGITFFETCVSTLIGTIILAACSYADKSFLIPRSIFFLNLLWVAPLVFLMRIAYDSIFKTRFLDKRSLIVGAGSLAKELLSTLNRTPHTGILPIGVLTAGENTGAKKGSVLEKVPVVGDTDDYKNVLKKNQVQLVILALESQQKDKKVNSARLFQEGVTLTSAVHLLEKLTGVMPRLLVEDSHYILGMVAEVRMRPYLKLKRILDVFAAIVLLILSSPVFLTAVLVLFVSNPNQVFFVQDRVGLNGSLFRLIKLRSMTQVKNGRMVVTRLGKWLRKYRIDELPQLFNILLGDMSLIGPRPEIPYFVTRSSAKIPMYETVFAVKPGLTGWAQVKFRYTTSIRDYREKFRYNMFYLKNMSFTLDILILFKTIRIVLFGQGQ